MPPVKPVVEPPPDLNRFKCLECDLPYPECSRRSYAISGHEFVQGEPRW